MNPLQSWLTILLLFALVFLVAYIILDIQRQRHQAAQAKRLPVGTILRTLYDPEYAIVTQVRDSRFAVMYYTDESYFEYDIDDLENKFEIITPKDSPLDVYDKVLIRKLRDKFLRDI